MLHVWLIPMLIVFLVVLAGFYLLIRAQGGTGVRSDGKTVVDKPGVDEDMPPS